MSQPVHPRGRGERRCSNRLAQRMPGSSPRARGTPRAGVLRTGFRPVHPRGAGNAGSAGVTRYGDSVHPRGRGERRAELRAKWGRNGSSPRARGTPLQLAVQQVDFRFIPAGAGNAFERHVFGAEIRVHPRGRGECRAGTAGAAETPGSSPRARGTPGIGLGAGWRDRFIPAGAGNAKPRACRPARTPVHPRGRGERPPFSTVGGLSGGSSPRARGTPCPTERLGL